MKAFIKKQNLADEFYTSEKCYITEVSNNADDPDVSIARARIEPGVTTAWHRLKGTSERYVIVSGKGLVEADELREELNPGDMVFIPSMYRQRITNIGNEDLIFLAICSPRFTDSCYEEIELESD